MLHCLSYVVHLIIGMVKNAKTLRKHFFQKTLEWVAKNGISLSSDRGMFIIHVDRSALNGNIQ
jgi:hypothetical protein